MATEEITQRVEALKGRLAKATPANAEALVAEMAEIVKHVVDAQLGNMQALADVQEHLKRLDTLVPQAK